VPEWEAAVLEAVHGTQALTVGPRSKVKGRVLPETAEVDYQRLLVRYGADEVSGVPFVAQVFGLHGVGLQNLARTMEQSMVPTSRLAGGEDDGEEDDGKQAAIA
jgi:hypothetical protein